MTSTNTYLKEIGEGDTKNIDTSLKKQCNDSIDTGDINVILSNIHTESNESNESNESKESNESTKAEEYAFAEDYKHETKEVTSIQERRKHSARISITCFKNNRIMAFSTGTYGYVVHEHIDGPNSHVLKVMNYSSDEDIATIREIMWAVWFSHFGQKHIPLSPFYDYIRYDKCHGKWGFSMENGGVDLRRFITDRKMYPNKYLLKVAASLLVAMYDMHRVGFLHRDIKPENFIWDPLTNKLSVVDFSLSCLETSPYPRCNRVQTRWYRSPEVIVGSSTYDNKSDVWSIGIMLIELLTGYLIHGKSATDQLWLILCNFEQPSHTSDMWKLPRWPRQKDGTLILPNLEYVWSGSIFEKLNTLFSGLGDLIKTMVSVDPNERPSMVDIMKTETVSNILSFTGIKKKCNIKHQDKCIVYGYELAKINNMFEAFTTDGKKVINSSIQTLQCTIAVAKALVSAYRMSFEAYVGLRAWFGYTAVLFYTANEYPSNMWMPWTTGDKIIAIMHVADVCSSDMSGRCLDYINRHHVSAGIDSSGARSIVDECIQFCPYVMGLYMGHPFQIIAKYLSDDPKMRDVWRTREQLLIDIMVCATFESITGKIIEQTGTKKENIQLYDIYDTASLTKHVYEALQMTDKKQSELHANIKSRISSMILFCDQLCV